MSSASMAHQQQQQQQQQPNIVKSEQPHLHQQHQPQYHHHPMSIHQQQPSSVPQQHQMQQQQQQQQQRRGSQQQMHHKQQHPDQQQQHHHSYQNGQARSNHHAFPQQQHQQQHQQFPPQMQHGDMSASKPSFQGMNMVPRQQQQHLQQYGQQATQYHAQLRQQQQAMQQHILQYPAHPGPSQDGSYNTSFYPPPDGHLQQQHPQRFQPQQGVLGDVTNFGGNNRNNVNAASGAQTTMPTSINGGKTLSVRGPSSSTISPSNGTSSPSTTPSPHIHGDRKLPETASADQSWDTSTRSNKVLPKNSKALALQKKGKARSRGISEAGSPEIGLPESTTAVDANGKSYEVYQCPQCDKQYTGAHGRSIWRRHIQDKHNVPLAAQPRRTRWDGDANRPKTAEDRRERTLNSKRKWARKKRAQVKVQSMVEKGITPPSDLLAEAEMTMDADSDDEEGGGGGGGGADEDASASASASTSLDNDHSGQWASGPSSQLMQTKTSSQGRSNSVQTVEQPHPVYHHVQPSAVTSNGNHPALRQDMPAPPMPSSAMGLPGGRSISQPVYSNSMLALPPTPLPKQSDASSSQGEASTSSSMQQNGNGDDGALGRNSLYPIASTPSRLTGSLSGITGTPLGTLFNSTPVGGGTSGMFPLDHLKPSPRDRGRPLTQGSGTPSAFVGNGQSPMSSRKQSLRLPLGLSLDDNNSPTRSLRQSNRHHDGDRKLPPLASLGATPARILKDDAMLGSGDDGDMMISPFKKPMSISKARYEKAYTPRNRTSRPAMLMGGSSDDEDTGLTFSSPSRGSSSSKPSSTRSSSKRRRGDSPDFTDDSGISLGMTPSLFKENYFKTPIRSSHHNSSLLTPMDEFPRTVGRLSPLKNVLHSNKKDDIFTPSPSTKYRSRKDSSSGRLGVR
ncbi:unnamed protein product [Sympodiomycopsis kandeliae]